MSASLDRADEAIRRLLPYERIELFDGLARYCSMCGRVGERRLTASGWYCHPCDYEWTGLLMPCHTVQLPGGGYAIQRAQAKPLKYKWRKSCERWELLLFGEPDCYAYMIRYQSDQYRRMGWERSVWCWRLTMPRGASEVARGFAHSADAAKQQVEAAIAEHWA